jgi:mRNA-degrading endonuclease RelE of RelBE toxin-antitoxin system
LIRHHKYFKHQIKKLPRELQRRVLAAIEEYHESGRGDVQKVMAELERLRVGDYRVFQGWVGGELRVVGVFHRRFEYARYILRAVLKRVRNFRE